MMCKVDQEEEVCYSGWIYGDADKLG